MARYTYPHVIENGAGERITFAQRSAGPNGDRIEGENVVKPGAGAPMHVHFLQDEVFTVMEGRIAYQRPGEPPRYAGPGETVAFKAGEPHKFWNPGESDLRVAAYIQPADNAEYLLTELFDSTRRNGGSRPDPFDVAFLMTRYRSEFAMLEIPALVRRIGFPLLVALGTLLGRYRRFAGAPEPVRRRLAQ